MAPTRTETARSARAANYSVLAHAAHSSVSSGGNLSTETTLTPSSTVLPRTEGKKLFAKVLQLCSAMRATIFTVTLPPEHRKAIWN